MYVLLKTVAMTTLIHYEENTMDWVAYKQWDFFFFLSLSHNSGDWKVQDTRGQKI